MTIGKNAEPVSINLSSPDKLNLLRKQDWKQGAGYLVGPLSHTVANTVNLVLEDGNWAAMVDKIHQQIPQTNDDDFFRVHHRLEQLMKRGSHAINLPDFSKVPGVRSKVQQVKVDDSLINRIIIPDENVLLEATDKEARDGLVILTPGLVQSMPFVVDGGSYLGEVDGKVISWAFLQASYIAKGAQNYLQINPTYGMEQIWSESSQSKFAAHKTYTKLTRYADYLNRVINTATPFEGGLPGTGKRY